MSKTTPRSPKAASPNVRPTASASTNRRKSGQSKARTSAQETAQYVAEFAAELSHLAHEAELNLLAYLLDVARLEAVRVLLAQEEP